MGPLARVINANQKTRLHTGQGPMLLQLTRFSNAKVTFGEHDLLNNDSSNFFRRECSAEHGNFIQAAFPIGVIVTAAAEE